MTGVLITPLDKLPQALAVLHDVATRQLLRLERANANLVGSDINGGAQDIRQLFAPPSIRLYATPAGGLSICPSSSPLGAGVHGLCGCFAARGLDRVLRSVFLHLRSEVGDESQHRETHLLLVNLFPPGEPIA